METIILACLNLKLTKKKDTGIFEYFDILSVRFAACLKSRVGLFQYLTIDGDIELKHCSMTYYLKRYNRIAGGF